MMPLEEYRNYLNHLREQNFDDEQISVLGMYVSSKGSDPFLERKDIPAKYLKAIVDLKRDCDLTNDQIEPFLTNYSEYTPDLWKAIVWARSRQIYPDDIVCETISDEEKIARIKERFSKHRLFQKLIADDMTLRDKVGELFRSHIPAAHLQLLFRTLTDYEFLTQNIPYLEKMNLEMIKYFVAMASMYGCHDLLVKSLLTCNSLAEMQQIMSSSAESQQFVADIAEQHKNQKQ